MSLLNTSRRYLASVPLPHIENLWDRLLFFYLLAVPSLIFSTNIGERAYQDVFFVGVFVYAVLRGKADWSPMVLWIWGGWGVFCLWSLLTDSLPLGEMDDDGFKVAAMLLLLPWLVALARRESFLLGIRYGVKIAVVVGAITAIVQVFLLGLGRAHGGDNANIFAFMLAIYGVFAVHDSLVNRRRSVYLWVVLATIAVVLSGSRMTMVALAVTFLVMFWFYRDRLNLKENLAIILVGAVVLVLVGGAQVKDRAMNLVSTMDRGSEGRDLWADFLAMDFTIPADGTGVDSSRQVREEFRSSLGYRLILWRVGWEVFKDSPWTGVGNQKGIDVIADHIGVGEEFSDKFSHVHNTFIQQLVAGGAPRLGLLLLVLLTPIFLLWKARCRDSMWLVTLVSLVSGVAGLTAAVFELFQFSFPYALLLAYALVPCLGKSGPQGSDIVAARVPAAGRGKAG